MRRRPWPESDAGGAGDLDLVAPAGGAGDLDLAAPEGGGAGDLDLAAPCGGVKLPVFGSAAPIGSAPRVNGMNLFGGMAPGSPVRDARRGRIE